MRRQTIAVDIDDVLANSTEALRREVNRRLGVNLRPEHYLVPSDHYWNYYESVWSTHGIDGQITMDDLDPQMKADQSHIVPHKNAQEVLLRLAAKYRLIIITGRSSEWREATEAWLEWHFPGVFSDLLFGEGKEGIARKSKGDLCIESGADFLIDDNVEHATSAKNSGVEVIVFGNYGWQHGMPAHMTHCKDWKAVLEYFDERG